MFDLLLRFCWQLNGSLKEVEQAAKLLRDIGKGRVINFVHGYSEIVQSLLAFIYFLEDNLVFDGVSVEEFARFSYAIIHLNYCSHQCSELQGRRLVNAKRYGRANKVL